MSRLERLIFNKTSQLLSNGLSVGYLDIKPYANLSITLFIDVNESINLLEICRRRDYYLYNILYFHFHELHVSMS